MKRILITGAGGSASYNFIESLRHNPNNEKFYLVGADTSCYHLELAKVEKKYLVPRVDDSAYISKINKIIQKEKIDFLHCQPDPEVNFISRHRDEFNTKTFLPKSETINLCQDKMRFNTLLQKNKIPVPNAFYLQSENDLKIACSKLFKNNEKIWVRAIHGAGSKAALPVKKFQHAKMWINYWKIMKGIGYGEFMVSEFLPGAEYAFQSLWLNGKLLTSQARERVEYIFGNLTPSGQSSSPSVARTVNKKEINDLVYRAIKIIDPDASGIFCADMKTDQFGNIKLLEINAGRFFTTSFFFSAARLNMPYYYSKIGLGEKIDIPFKKFNNLESNLYWVRMIDMGYKLIKNNDWTSKKI